MSENAARRATPYDLNHNDKQRGVMYQAARFTRSTLVMLIAFVAVAMVADWTPQSAHAEETDSLSAAELALLESGDAVSVLLDADTGDIISVTEGSAVQPLGVVANGCTTTRACWYGYSSPLIPYGFDGTGAVGSWAQRGTFLTKNYSASVCWLPPGTPTQKCTAWFGKNSSIGFNAAVQGTRVQLR